MIIDFDRNQEISSKDREAVALLIQQGFWGKLKTMFRRVSDEKALKILEQAITFKKGFYYKHDGTVLGVALLGTWQTPYMIFDKQLRKILGVWNWLMLHFSFNVIKPKKEDGLKLEMLAVSPQARGTGIGTKMLDHLENLAIEEDYDRITLEVIDTNGRAKKLYESKGYQAVQYVNTALFSRRFGFLGFHKMKKNRLIKRQ